MRIGKMKEKVSFFIDRKKELAELGEPGGHVVLIGYRRMGKTHLIIKHLLEAKGRKTVPVYVDMLYFASWEEFADSLVDEFLSAYDEATGKKVSVLFTRLAGSVSSALSSVKEIEGSFGAAGVDFLSLRIAFREKKKSEFELLKGAFDFISEFSAKNGVSAIIALDEIQNINSFNDMEKGLSIIRGELQFSKSIRLIMSGSLPSFIHSSILEKSRPFWKQLKTMGIEPFGIEAVSEAARAMEINEKNCKEVLAATNGVPDYVVKVLSKMKAGKSTGEAFEEVVAEEEMFLSSLISSLSRADHIAIGRIAKGEGYAGIEKALGYPPTAVLNSLMRQGLVKREGKGNYVIIDPGLKWILKH